MRGSTLALRGFVLLATLVSCQQERRGVNQRDDPITLYGEPIKYAMLSSIRTSWEQGAAAMAILELDEPEYSVFASTPFELHYFPAFTLRFALSAAVRQGTDGRLSQKIDDSKDGAALDGASAGVAVMLGSWTDSYRTAYWKKAAAAQLNYLLKVAPRTSTGAISHRADRKEYWSDGVFMGFPFIAYYGAVTKNKTLLTEAYKQCNLYRTALRISNGPKGPLWAHIRNNNGAYPDKGLWSTGNAWAALGMVHVQATLMKSSFASNFTSEIGNLKSWVKEILDGTLKAMDSNHLVPDYVSGGARFGDAAASSALAAVAFRSAVLDERTFGGNYTKAATNIMNSVLGSLDDLGILKPVVNPLSWQTVSILSTEGQSFGLMMLAAHRDWHNTLNG